MDARQLMTQLVSDLSVLSPVELDMYRADTRRFAAWNRRAALLRARDAGADAELGAFIDQTVQALENAFQNANWVRFGDAVAGLDPITPLPSPEELARLARANNAAAQTVASIALAGELVNVAETFLNIVNGRIGAGAEPAALDSTDESSAALRSSGSKTSGIASGDGASFSMGIMTGAVGGMLLAAALLKRKPRQ